ncbi:MAG: hypothetical protein ACLFO2_04475 [Candidatus Woesearchaeota archaeon]
MEIRKLQIVGNRSYSISLPKGWVLQNNLKPKDNIYISEEANNTLCITASEGTQENHNYTFKLDNISHVKEFVRFCYEKNIKNIRFFWDTHQPKKINAVKDILRYLDGYDLVQEGEGFLEIAFLFNEFNITLNKLLNRTIYLLTTQFESIMNGSEEDIRENEISIDKIYLLAKRIIFASIRNQKLRTENKITYDEEIFSYKNIFKKLENIADVLYEMRDKKFNEKDMAKLKQVVEHLKTTIVKRKIPESESIFSKDPLTDFFFHRINSLKEDIEQEIRTMDFIHTYFT